MSVCISVIHWTHRGWAHQQWVSTLFSQKNSHIFLVLLTLQGSNSIRSLMSYNLEFDAGPNSATPSPCCFESFTWRDLHFRLSKEMQSWVQMHFLGVCLELRVCFGDPVVWHCPDDRKSALLVETNERRITDQLILYVNVNVHCYTVLLFSMFWAWREARHFWSRLGLWKQEYDLCGGQCRNISLVFCR